MAKATHMTMLTKSVSTAERVEMKTPTSLARAAAQSFASRWATRRRYTERLAENGIVASVVGTSRHAVER
jgi:hypothetical protein